MFTPKPRVHLLEVGMVISLVEQMHEVRLDLAFGRSARVGHPKARRRSLTKLLRIPFHPPVAAVAGPDLDQGWPAGEHETAGTALLAELARTFTPAKVTHGRRRL
jgi:hypothetical protein